MHVVSRELAKSVKCCWRRTSIIRGGMEKYLTPMGPTKLHVSPIFEISPLEPRFSEWLVRFASSTRLDVCSIACTPAG